MNTSGRIRGVSALLCALFILSACNLPSGSATTSAPVPPAASGTEAPATVPAASTATPAAGPEHRIGVRVVDGVGEFYDRQTGEKFVPRGNNYIRLDPQKREDGSTQVYHSVFDPGLYDKPEITTAFQQMHALGYNTVRVFVSQNTIGTDTGLSEDYMNNVIDFLELAKEYDLYVIITQDWLPGGRYGRILGRDCCDTFNMMNAHFLPQAGLDANLAYFQDFIWYLIRHDAPIEMIFSYELRNELFFDMNFPPLSLTSGQVTALDGQTYDMSSTEDKKRMIDSNMVLWMDTIRDAIREIDPTALVSVGFFWPQEPNRTRVGDERYVDSEPAIWDSQLDFVDLHPYPGQDLTLPQYVENFGINGMQEKPIIMGEFGVTSNGHSLTEAANMLVDWQVQSCQYGFDGWLLWSWDIYENHDFYSARTGNGQIGQALAPVNRPDPCQAE